MLFRSAFCEFDTSPISQNKNSHSQAITALTFLPAPKSGSTFHEYQKYVDKARDTRMEKAIGEAAEKCGTMDKKSFVNGAIDTFEDALTCVANTVCCLKFFCSYTAGDYNPDIIKILEKFADLITTRKFRKFIDENISRYTGNEMHLYDISYRCTNVVHSTEKYFRFYVSYRVFCPSYRSHRYEGPLISVRH